jgi:uncharacterized repeat protein (TIGR03806 family)
MNPAASGRRIRLLAAVLILLLPVAIYRVLTVPDPAPVDSEEGRYRLDPEWAARLRSASDSEDWPQWRGPRRDGVSGMKIRDGAPRPLWKVRGGEGHSGIAVAGNRLYTMVQEGNDEVVLCLDVASGQVRWRSGSSGRFSEPSSGVGPRSTPAVADGRVYALGAAGRFQCLDAATGQVQWHHDLAPLPLYGFSSSPLVEGDRVIVQAGGIAAYDCRSGRREWSSNEPGGYSSPVAAVMAGRRQIVAVTGDSLLGLAPDNGKILWRTPWKTHLDFNVATPVVDGDTVFVSSGYGKGCALFRVGSDLSVTQVCANTRMKNTFSTSVVDRGHLYGFDDDFLSCMDLATGTVGWKTRAFGKGTLVFADDRLLVLGEAGRLAVVDADPAEYREQWATTISSSRSWTAPTLARGRLFVRDQEFIQAFDIEATASDVPERVPWQTSKVKGTPDPPPPYRTTVAFPGLTFRQPVDLVGVPGTEFLAVAERTGAVRMFTPTEDVRSTSLLVDLGRETLGLAFHPDFVRNGHVFVVHASTPPGFMRVTRLTAKKGTHWVADPASALKVLEWPSKGSLFHNGGALRFGQDGCLYVGVGDGSAFMDEDATGQDLRDLAASILRIDVNREPPYAIPSDNPFRSHPGARPEIWAYGVRQPWKMSFDGGDLWVGDVGEEGWESILKIRRGGNYGWSVQEGGHPFRADRGTGPTAIDPPAAVHAHTEFRSITGGVVYRGRSFGELVGSYVYGDFMTGSVWELRRESGTVTRHRELASTLLQIVGFCGEPGGELHLLDYRTGTIHRLVPNPAAPNPAFPRRLSETGLFESARNHRPAAGVVSYEVNAPLWADGAAKERLLALPGTSRIGFDRNLNEALKPNYPVWDFPVGTVLVKTFALERRIETRLLALLESGPGDVSWKGFSYRWTDDQTDAVLVEAAGEDLVLPGGQKWRIPGRAECRMCHTPSASFVLGVTTIQMNRDVGGVNQLKRFEHLGLFDAPLPRAPSVLPRLVDWADGRQDLELRARSYLHANCAHCHVPLGGGNSSFQLHAFLSLRQTGILEAAPVHGAFGLTEARIVASGAPERSALLHRMTTTGAGRMPPLATSVVDPVGTRLLSEWIRGLNR